MTPVSRCQRRRIVASAMLCMVTVVALVAAMAVGATSASAAPSVGERCAALARLTLPDTTVRGAIVDQDGTFKVPQDQGGIGEDQPGTVEANLPAFCDVTMIRTNPPARDQVHIEVWLPLSTWNGRFDGVGGGGFVAGISYRALAAAVRSGYAAASTDTGHPAAQDTGTFALDAAGALDWPVIDDFADRAVHEMTVAGKSVTTGFYGMPADHTYFSGCSMGGRQGLTEAERYPNDYEGIVAGAPAVNFAHLAPAQLWPQFVEKRAGDFLPSCKFAAFQRAVVTRCDTLDGVADDVVSNFAACRFDARTLVGHTTPCGVITSTDAEVMTQIWQGTRADEISSGRFLWYGTEPTSDGAALGQRPWYISTSWFQYWVTQQPNFDWTTMNTTDFTRLFNQGVQEFGPSLDNSADLTNFRDAGGKLILWTGMSDQYIPSQDTIQYYKSVTRQSGRHSSDSFARMFLAPGVGHCGYVGNSGAVPVDPLGALTGWVEHGVAPTSLPATKVVDGRVVQSRPVCRYPLVAKYTGHGSTDDARNFSCAHNFGGHR